MQPFEIFFLNNGAAIFQTDEFCHCYDDYAKQLPGGRPYDFLIY